MQVNESSSRPSKHGKGYVKVYRKLLTSAAFHNERTLKVWIWCLLRACYEPSSIDFVGEQTDLKDGDFITGTFSAARELNMSESAVWRNLRKLEKWGNIKIKAGNKFTIISVINYTSYQDEIVKIEKQTETKRETSENQAVTYKKLKETKDSKESTCTRPHNVEEVINYMTEISCNPSEVEGASFWDYFSSNGWKVGGKTPMKDWKAAARNWKRRKDENGLAGKTSYKRHGAGGETTKFDVAQTAKRIIEERRREQGS